MLPYVCPAALTLSLILSGAMGINMMQLQDIMDKRALKNLPDLAMGMQHSLFLIVSPWYLLNNLLNLVDVCSEFSVSHRCSINAFGFEEFT